MRAFLVQQARAHMPSSCKGDYRRIAVIEVDSPLRIRVSSISDRAMGVIKIVQVWETLNVGKTERCAFSQAMVQAQKFCKDLNYVCNQVVS